MSKKKVTKKIIFYCYMDIVKIDGNTNIKFDVLENCKSSAPPIMAFRKILFMFILSDNIPRVFAVNLTDTTTIGFY